MKIKIKKKQAIRIGIIVLILFILGIVWINTDPLFKSYEDIGMQPSLDISDNLQSGTDTHQFEKMIATVGFNQFLHDNGPFTVFAPTDKAFNNLSKEQKDFLAKPDEQGTLRQLLLYHIVKGKYLTSDLKDGMTLTTIEGDQLHFKKYNGNWLINDYAYFTTYDIVTKNGVIHTVTSYLFPSDILL